MLRTKMNRGIDILTEILQRKLIPVECIVKDESALHSHHSGNSGGKHYKLRIVCLNFEGKSLLERHRIIYSCLGNLMHTEIHALAIHALAPSELRKFNRK